MNFNADLFNQLCEQANLTCAICLEPYDNPHATGVCLHAFCLECIRQISNCPSCRKPFSAKNLMHDFDKDERVEKIRHQILTSSTSPQSARVDQLTQLKAMNRFNNAEDWRTEKADLQIPSAPPLKVNKQTPSEPTLSGTYLSSPSPSDFCSYGRYHRGFGEGGSGCGYTRTYGGGGGSGC